MHLDLGTILNLISTLTLIGALVFTGLQLRASNRTRREQAAIAVIQSAQSEARMETKIENGGLRMALRVITLGI